MIISTRHVCHVILSHVWQVRVFMMDSTTLPTLESEIKMALWNAPAEKAAIVTTADIDPEENEVDAAAKEVIAAEDEVVADKDDTAIDVVVEEYVAAEYAPV